MFVLKKTIYQCQSACMSKQFLITFKLFLFFFCLDSFLCFYVFLLCFVLPCYLLTFVFFVSVSAKGRGKQLQLENGFLSYYFGVFCDCRNSSNPQRRIWKEKTGYNNKLGSRLKTQRASRKKKSNEQKHQHLSCSCLKNLLKRPTNKPSMKKLQSFNLIFCMKCLKQQNMH